MKFLITIIALLFSSFSFSQSIIGKWKPVFFIMDTIMRGDVKADTLFINNEMLKKELKNDKDPEASKQMMEFLFQTMFRDMKETQEEYLENKTFKEINTRTGNNRSGTYTFDQQNKTLVKTYSSTMKKESFIISWKNEQLVLTGELGNAKGKKGKLEVVYQRL